MSEQPKAITVYAESSPNPNSLKFVVNFQLLENISLDYPTAEDTGNCPLAADLYKEFPFIQRIFIAGNFVTITKDEETDWYEVNPQVRAYLKDYFQAGKPLFSEAIETDLESQAKENTSEDEIEAKIISLLEEYVRPAVEQDGGAITFHSFEEGKVKVLLQGACSGCPSSTLTLKSGIENLLKRMIPEVEEVVAEGV